MTDDCYGRPAWPSVVHSVAGAAKREEEIVGWVVMVDEATSVDGERKPLYIKSTPLFADEPLVLTGDIEEAYLAASIHPYESLSPPIVARVNGARLRVLKVRRIVTRTQKTELL